MWCLRIPSLAHISLNRRPVLARGILKFPTAFFSDWKGFPSCLVFIRVVSSKLTDFFLLVMPQKPNREEEIKKTGAEVGINWWAGRIVLLWIYTEQNGDLCAIWTVRESTQPSVQLHGTAAPCQGAPVLPVQRPCGFFSPWIKQYGKKQTN